MAHWSTALSAGTFILSLAERADRKQEEEQIDNQTASSEQGAPSDYSLQNEVAKNTEGTERKLQRLVEIERSRDPVPGDKDAYTSSTIALNDGETAEVTVEPQDGWNLRVKRIHFDRQDDHQYEINVGGDVTSVSHRAKYVKPKKVAQSDRVLATVTNNSGSSTVVDFEMEAWAERPQRS